MNRLGLLLALTLAAVHAAGAEPAAVVVLDRDGQPVAESTSTQFHF